MSRFAFCLIAFFSSSCGYHFTSQDQIKTIKVPYVEGDFDGTFTSTLIKKIVQKNAIAYSSCGAYCLRVCLQAPEDDTIGYRFVRDENGQRSKILASHEARLDLVAQVTLLESGTGKIVLGPLPFRSSLTYDFQSDFTHVDQHEFSLGQLEMRPLAKDAAFPSLYELLAQKIVDYVAPMMID